MCFPVNRLKCCRRGCADKRKPALPQWGFSHLGRQTECERIPRPRKIFRLTSDRRHLCAGPSRLFDGLRIRPDRSSIWFALSSYFLDEACDFPVAKKPANSLAQEGTSCVCFVRGNQQNRYSPDPLSKRNPRHNKLLRRAVGWTDPTFDIARK